MKKKIIGVLLTLCMIVGMLPVSVFAQENTIDTWDGTADTSWYDENKTEFEISTAEELAGLAVLVNRSTDYKTFEGKTIRLTTDLDLSGHEWISIGWAGGANYWCFSGCFDGQGHNIYNLYSHESGSKGGNKTTGLFGALYGGEIKNLGVLNADILRAPEDTSLHGRGILADEITDSVITNCYTSGTIVGSSSANTSLGGIAGLSYRNSQIKGCYSTAVITVNYEVEDGCFDSVGGILGSGSADLITDCWYGGTITVNSILAAVGGIVGYSEETEINNCMIATTDIGVDSDGNTCWIGYEVAKPVTNCVYPNDEKYGTNPGNYPENEDEIPAGMAADNFKDDAVLSKLKENAADGVEWVAGINHPTFSWDKRNIPADYSKVDEAIKKANALNKDEYKDFSAVETAIAAVIRGKNITEQTTVDGYATAIENAIAALEYKDADYTAVDEAIAKANALNKDDYKDFSAVETAIAAVVRGKNITEQATVDGYATAIENAIAALEYKDADYSKVDEAIAKANALNKAEYKDFSAVESAIAAVVRGKNITEQATVNGYATAIENAIKALEYKGADYSKVDEAIAKAEALDKNQYKDFSAVEAAIAAVVRDKNITEQATVDGYATAIENAIAALEYKDADYSKVDEAITKAEALNKDEYKDFSAVEAAIAAVVRDKNITEQAEVDAMAKAINDAIASIEKKPTDKPTSPETGDNSNMILWIALLFVSGASLTGMAVTSKKRRTNR